MRYAILVGVCALTAVAGTARAGNALDQLSQDQFRLLSQDLAASLNDKALSPDEPLNRGSSDLDVNLVSPLLARDGLLNQANFRNAGDVLPIPRVRFDEGLSSGVDVGGFYSALPDSSFNLWGAEARYSLLNSGIAHPALAVRGSFTRLSGSDQLNLDTAGLELSVSKGFSFFTPYAGLGRVWVRSSPNVSSLDSEDFAADKYFLGAKLNLGVFNLNLEGDRTGDATSYRMKFGWRF